MEPYYISRKGVVVSISSLGYCTIKSLQGQIHWYHLAIKQKKQSIFTGEKCKIFTRFLYSNRINRKWGCWLELFTTVIRLTKDVHWPCPGGLPESSPLSEVQGGSIIPYLTSSRLLSAEYADKQLHWNVGRENVQMSEYINIKQVEPPGFSRNERRKALSA